MTKKLSGLRRPFLCAVVAERSAAECVWAVDRLEESVDAFEVNLAQLAEGSVREVFASTSRPCIATHRRARFMSLYGYKALGAVSDLVRAERLLAAVDSGSAAIDFELDIFGRKNAKGAVPRLELTTDPRAVRKQRELAQDVQSRGAEVIISCHSRARMQRRETLRIAHAIERRGADYAKLVFRTDGASDVIEMLQAVLELKEELGIPFNLMNMGELSQLGRLLSIAFGSSWLYCRAPSKVMYAGQPTVRDALDFLSWMKKDNGSGLS
jgi:3-dehydroquinate dehydratase